MRNRFGYEVWIVFIISGISIIFNPHAIPKLNLEYPDNFYYGGTIIVISVIALIFKFILLKIDKNE
jgi:hypothetical protein